jgi:hypothetical protein
MKNILLIILLLISNEIINAQKVKTFFEIGINHNHAKEKVFYDNVKTIIYKPGIDVNIGLKLVAKIDELFDFKTGFYVNSNSYKLKYTNQHHLHTGQQTVNENHTEYLYFNIPLLLSCKVNKNIAFNIGTGLNINLKDVRYNLNHKYDIPLNVGFTYRIKRTTFDIQYSIGNLHFATNKGYYGDIYTTRNYSYSTFFHRQLTLNIGRCLNRKSKTKWN